VDHRLHIAYEITNLSAQRRSAKGHTIMVTLDTHGSLLMVTPPAIAERL
jgi:acyl-CoA thioesterase FadM